MLVKYFDLARLMIPNSKVLSSCVDVFFATYLVGWLMVFLGGLGPGGLEF